MGLCQKFITRQMGLAAAGNECRKSLLRENKKGVTVT